MTGILYLFGYWLHFPYGGGHIYSDIVTVFQFRECNPTCTLPIPYIQTFVEYPVIVAIFMYVMGLLGRLFGGDLLNTYYVFTCLFLLIPTLLLVRETTKIGEMVGAEKNRVLRYLVVTPSFVIMLLLNWYAIGVFFSVFAMRKFLEGSRTTSGALFGLSAASNLVTALPAIGMTVAAKGLRERVRFVAGGVVSFGIVNLPFLALNPNLWLEFWQYHYNWYVEGSWMQAFLDIFSPLRHPISTGVFVVLAALILFRTYRTGTRSALQLSWIFTFVFLFSTYVFTPQMNLIMLPFFALAPITKHYLEFLVFDLINSLVIVLAYSQALLVLGLTYSFPNAGVTSLVGFFVVARSLWTGKFATVDGIREMRATNGWQSQ